MFGGEGPPGGNAMLMIDVLRVADSDYVIYFLLTAYIEAARYSNKLPAHLTDWPLFRTSDVKERFDKFVGELYITSKRPDAKACVLMSEALHLFGTALHRLRELERARCPPPAGMLRERGRLRAHSSGDLTAL